MRIALDTNVTIAGDKDLLILINHGQVKFGLSATFLCTQGHGHRVPTLEFLYIKLGCYIPYYQFLSAPFAPLLSQNMGTKLLLWIIPTNEALIQRQLLAPVYKL